MIEWTLLSYTVFSGENLQKHEILSIYFPDILYEFQIYFLEKPYRCLFLNVFRSWCWFSGGFLMGFPKILNILRNYAEGWTMSAFVGICHTSCLPKFGHQMLHCLSIRYIVSAKIFSALLLCQKNWVYNKVHLNDFYPLLRSIAFSWIHIGVKRIPQSCCLHHLKNMEKYCKTQLWDEKQNRMLFLTTP